MNSLLKSLLKATGVDPYLRVCLKENSALRQLGWFRSGHELASVDAQGRPIPWIAYPAIAFLDERLSRELSVFEYGAGNSTMWFAERAQRVQSLEHTDEWAERIRPLLPANAVLDVRTVNDDRHYDVIAFLGFEEENAYTQFILEQAERYDVIVVDGIYRNACIASAIQRLSTCGVLVLDNTDFPAFAPGLALLRQREFRRIDFTGMCPITQVLSRTSIVYRDGNCLGI